MAAPSVNQMSRDAATTGLAALMFARLTPVNCAVAKHDSHPPVARIPVPWFGSYLQKL